MNFLKQTKQNVLENIFCMLTQIKHKPIVPVYYKEKENVWRLIFYSYFMLIKFQKKKFNVLLQNTTNSIQIDLSNSTIIFILESNKNSQDILSFPIFFLTLKISVVAAEGTYQCFIF